MTQDADLSITVYIVIIDLNFIGICYGNLPMIANDREFCFGTVEGKAVDGIVIEKDLQIGFDVRLNVFCFLYANIAG